MPYSNTTNGATATARIDTRGFDYAIVRVPFDTWTNSSSATATISMLHSDDTVVTNFATIVANKTHAVTDAATMVSYRIDLRGKKRYLRTTITPGATTNDLVTCGVDYSLYRPDEAPGNTTDMTHTAYDGAVVVP